MFNVLSWWQNDTHDGAHYSASSFDWDIFLIGGREGCKSVDLTSFALTLRNTDSSTLRGMFDSCRT